MAKQHAHRLKEKAERQLRQEEEGIVGFEEEAGPSERVSPWATQTVDLNDLMIDSQGTVTLNTLICY